MVKENPGVIAILPNPSEAVQLEAVKADLFVIGKIKEPSEQVQLTAIQKAYIRYKIYLILLQKYYFRQ